MSFRFRFIFSHKPFDIYSCWTFFRYSTVAALLVGYAKRAFTSLRNTSSSIRLKPILSNVRSNIKSHPLRRILLTLDRTRRTSSRSRSHASRSSPYKSSCGWRLTSSLEIHSFASLCCRFLCK